VIDNAPESAPYLDVLTAPPSGAGNASEVWTTSGCDAIF
jgi:hypothetical protein